MVAVLVADGVKQFSCHENDKDVTKIHLFVENVVRNVNQVLV